jgi:FxLD family lantipeptide
VTVQLDQVVPVAGPTPAEEWDLDINFVEAGGVVADLLRLTDDGCGTTCESACNSC